MFVRTKITSPSSLKDNFPGYRILGWWFFPLKKSQYSTPPSSCLHGFWEVGCNSHPVPLQVKAFLPPWHVSDFPFDFLKYEYNLFRYQVGFFFFLDVFCFSFILLDILWIFCNWCKFGQVLSHYCFKYCFCSFLSFFFWHSYYTYISPFRVVPQFLNTVFSFFPSLFYLYFSGLKVYTEIFSHPFP